MKTLVTGASGFVGTNLTRKLVERGEDVRVLLRERSDTRGIDDLPIERTYGDIRDPWAVREAVEGCRRVYHLAALVDVSRAAARRLREINLAGAIHVAAACRRGGVERLVFTSSIATIGHGTLERPATEVTQFNLGHLGMAYLDTKRDAEGKLLEFHRAGLDLVIVNPGYIFGAWDKKPNSGAYVQLAAAGLPLFSFPGGISVVDVDDVVEGHIRAMDRGRAGQRYILSGENLPYDTFLTTLGEVVHRPRPVIRMPDGVAALIGALGDLLSTLSGRSVPVGRDTMRLVRLGHYVSSEKARQELGMTFAPARGALEKAYLWMKEHGTIR